MKFGGVEFANAKRAYALDRTLGLGIIRDLPGVAAPASYSLVSDAPWYNAAVPASTQFGGYYPLSVAGLDDSSREAKITEYTGSGGNVGQGRNATQSLVFSGVLIASTEAGVEYGLRWLSNLLSAKSDASVSMGARLDYKRLSSATSEDVHRRDVSLSRAVSVTRKRARKCVHHWTITFTMTAADPFEYGTPLPQFIDLGAAAPTGDGVLTSGLLTLTQVECPVYTAKPFYDPANAPVVNAPTIVNFFPDGWNIKNGMQFRRHWVRLKPALAALPLDMVPYLRLHGTSDARMVRLSVWPNASPNDDQCGPLFSTVVTYAPANYDMYIDGEAQVSYVSDGLGANVRRADSLVYSPDAYPVRWDAFQDPAGTLVTLDLFAKDADDVGGYTGAGFQGDSNMRVDLSYISKSD